MNRIRAIAYWAVPPLFALLLYWPGLICWFQKDDFAWLGLRDMVANGQGLRWPLFAPLAQGTIRTLSERIFYLSLTSVFGLNPFPFRCWAFLTFAGSLPLIASVCAKLTGSRAAGFWAAILWTANGSMAFALSWTAIYYELLCSFNFLLSLWLLIRYVETGDRRFFVAQWITFLLGFGVLELNVVYPALASVYAWCCARRVLPKILPMWIPSAAYTVLHMAVAPLQPSGPYQMFWNASMFSTLWAYWKISLGPNRLMMLGIYPSAYRSTLTVLLIAGMVGFLAWKLRQRQWVALFFPAWFVIVLAPLLPLKNHISDYYLTIPLIGLAMWGAWALVCGWRAGTMGRMAVLCLLAIYLGVSIPVARVNLMSFYDRSQKIQRMVLNVVEVRRHNPGKTILLKGVDDDMFWSAVYHRAFRLYGVDEVYLAPEDSFAQAPKEFYSGAAADRAIVVDVRAIAEHR